MTEKNVIYHAAQAPHSPKVDYNLPHHQFYATLLGKEVDICLRDDLVYECGILTATLLSVHTYSVLVENVDGHRILVTKHAINTIEEHLEDEG